MIELLLQADRLLTVDMVDQADAIYRRVAEADPNNAIAVVGMARCALARADDHEAYRLAAKALVIDPQNDMARRMEARLAEVLANRGEMPPKSGAAATPSGPAAPSTLTPPPGAVPPPRPSAPLSSSGPGSTPSAAPAPPTSAAPSTAPRSAPAPATPQRRSLIDRLRGR